jgi:hypothetical protein
MAYTGPPLRWYDYLERSRAKDEPHAFKVYRLGLDECALCHRPFAEHQETKQK